MPEQYTRIKKSFMRRGDDEEDAKRKAAKTFIARGKGGTRSSRAKSLHGYDDDDDKPRKKKRTPKVGKP